MTEVGQFCREPWFLHQIYGVPADFPFNEFGDIVHLLSLFRMFSDWFFTIKLNSSRGLSLYHGQSSQCQACWSTFGHLWDKFDSQIWTAKTISWELIPERWNPPFQGHENHTKSPLFFPWFSHAFPTDFPTRAQLGAPHSAMKHTVDHKANEMLRRIH